MALLDRIAFVDSVDVSSRRVLVRMDLDVPLADGRVSDDAKLREQLPTLKHLLEHGARVIVAGHIGKPKKDGKKPNTSLEPVAAHFAAMLASEVVLTDECVGDGVKKVVHDLRDGKLAVLENLRTNDGEDANDETFARELARHVDVYVNDALRPSINACASVVALPSVVPVKLAGFTLKKELEAIARWIEQPELPSLAVIGGGRVEAKLRLMESLIGRVDAVLLGGAVANTMLTAMGKNLGRSSIDAQKLAAARDWFERAKARGTETIVPDDLMCGDSTDAKAGRCFSVDRVPSDMMALDVGPETVEAYRQKLMRSKTVLWDGPMGFAENAAFFAGTEGVARSIVEATGYSLVVGDDTVASAYKSGLAVRFSHVSRGGPASVELVEGRSLPGVEALRS